MSGRIDNVFAALRGRKEGALVAFITAGDPSIEGTPDTVVSLAEAGADILELGIPYSDPLADGPSIQNSSQRALDRGVTPETVFEIVREIRRKSQIPIVLMTSCNIVLKYGPERFAKTAAAAGADGAILTDLPPEEAAEWKVAADANGIATIFLVAPTSTPERIKMIAAQTTGFIYCVSRTGVTGARAELPVELRSLLQQVRASTDKPVCVGFGISKPEHVAQVNEISDGAVIGSALVDFLHQNAANPECDTLLRDKVSTWKAATKR